MSLDDLRAQAHEIARLVHDLDVDRREETARREQADIAFEARDEELSTKSHALAVALQNYDPTVPPPVPPRPLAPVEYARYCYNDPDITAKWPYQTLQGQPETIRRIPLLREAGLRKAYRYSHFLTRTANDQGIRQGYGVFKDSWLARDRNGSPIVSSKFRSGPDGRDPNLLIDVGLPEYQQASAEYLIGKCRDEGWDGIYLDECNEYTAYAGYTLPANYANEYRFQLAQLAYVQHVSTALRAAGFECHVNLASNANAWRNNITNAVDGNHIEFAFVQWTVNSPGAWHVASLENGEWVRAMDWIAYNEKHGKVTTVQADARTEQQVQYALTSLLLVTTGEARFAATRGGYGVNAAWWTPAMETARLLGQSTGPHTTTTSGVHRREFEHGVVSVNPSERPINTMPATSGLIELR